MGIHDIIRRARSQGWRVKLTARGHYKFYAPDGKGLVVVGSHLGDPRAVKNALAELRRRGMTA